MPHPSVAHQGTGQLAVVHVPCVHVHVSLVLCSTSAPSSMSVPFSMSAFCCTRSLAKISRCTGRLADKWLHHRSHPDVSSPTPRSMTHRLMCRDFLLSLLLESGSNLIGVSVIGIRLGALAAWEHRVLRPRRWFLDRGIVVVDCLFQITGRDIYANHACVDRQPNANTKHTNQSRRGSPGEDQ